MVNVKCWIVLLLFVLAAAVTAPAQVVSTQNVTVQGLNGLSIELVDAGSYTYSITNTSQVPIDLISVRWDWGTGSKTLIRESYYLSNSKFVPGQVWAFTPEGAPRPKAVGKALPVPSPQQFTKQIRSKANVVLSIDLIVVGKTQSGPDKSGSLARVKQRSMDVLRVSAQYSTPGQIPGVTGWTVPDQMRAQPMLRLFSDKATPRDFLGAVVEGANRFLSSFPGN